MLPKMLNEVYLSYIINLNIFILIAGGLNRFWFMIWVFLLSASAVVGWLPVLLWLIREPVPLRTGWLVIVVEWLFIVLWEETTLPSDTSSIRVRRFLFPQLTRRKKKQTKKQNKKEFNLI